jgi:hypothetical protein
VIFINETRSIASEHAAATDETVGTASDIILCKQRRRISIQGTVGMPCSIDTGDPAMKASTVSLHSNAVRGGWSLALAIGAFTVLSAARADAAELDPITVSAPITQKLEADLATDLPITSVTVNAKIDVDMDTLKNDSGVVLLKDRVAEAASKACFEANPFGVDDGACISKAVRAAKPQVNAVIARARSVG